jgi:uncharacterized membrane-anchored protein
MKSFLLISFLFFGMTAFADDTATENQQMTAEEFMALLKPSEGNISLPGNIATMNLGDKFQYLSPESAEKLLVDAWGNPPGNKTLGMVIPKSPSPLSAEGWGVVITYDEDGYVSDEDADDINYTDLLDDMKEESESINKERINAGYGSMLLVGWAESPVYDKQTHKFYWAKEFKTDADVNSLNYNIRVLGRKGVLVLNAVAGMNQMNLIKSEMPDLVAVTEFTKGNRYEEFNAETDHVAEYGLAALVAGGVAAKMGLFAKIGVFLVAFKKFIILGVIAFFGLISSIFKRKPKEST